MYSFNQLWHLYHCTGPEADAGLVAWFGFHLLPSEIIVHFCLSHPEFAKPSGQEVVNGNGQNQA
jgi:hypothetical protein